MVYEIEKTDGYVHFVFKEFSSEYSHLREPTEADVNTQDMNVKELLEKGKSYRDIAGILGISKSQVGKIAARLKSVSTAPGRDGRDKMDTVDASIFS